MPNNDGYSKQILFVEQNFCGGLPLELLNRSVPKILTLPGRETTADERSIFFHFRLEFRPSLSLRTQFVRSDVSRCQIKLIQSYSSLPFTTPGTAFRRTRCNWICLPKRYDSSWVGHSIVDICAHRWCACGVLLSPSTLPQTKLQPVGEGTSWNAHTGLLIRAMLAGGGWGFFELFGTFWNFFDLFGTFWN